MLVLRFLRQREKLQHFVLAELGCDRILVVESALPSAEE